MVLVSSSYQVHVQLLKYAESKKLADPSQIPGLEALIVVIVCARLRFRLVNAKSTKTSE